MQQRTKSVLDKYVNRDALAAILRDDGAKRPALTAAYIECVLVFVRGDTPDEISQRIGRVAEMAVSHGGVVHDMVCELVVIAFGTHPTGLLTAGKRAALVAQLGRELPGHLKIVHGAADGHYGLIGSESHMTYGFLLPHFNAMLGRLSRLEFGQIEEFAE
ncbi:MAG TPA: hypothetical protein VK742_17250 [Candidatus Sulfotelmatobacter sp.]|jgi:hypothetical protein|nr:hypothetical protein [Candidatus Sulfotelmatobacter sp.]